MHMHGTKIENEVENFATNPANLTKRMSTNAQKTMEKFVTTCSDYC
jgi:hypothetical protein